MIKHKYLHIIKRTILHSTKMLTHSTQSLIYIEMHSFTKLSLLNLHMTIQNFSTNKDRNAIVSQSQSNYRKYNLEIKQINSQNIVQCIDLTSRNFCQFQPLRQAFNIKYPSSLSQRINLHNQYFLQWKDQFLSNQLSKVADQKDINNNRTIIKSVMLAKDYSYIPPNISNYMNDFNVFSALNALYSETKKAMQPQWADILNQPERGIVAHFWLGATVSQLASAKIFSRLMVKGQQKAVERGYKYIVVWATNSKSGKISQKLNYKCISSIDTHNLQIFGERPFELTPQKHRFCCVWGKLI